MNTNFVTVFVRCTDSYGGVNQPSDFCREIIGYLHLKNYLWVAFGKLLILFSKQSPKYSHINDKIELLIDQYPEPPEELPVCLFTRLPNTRELASKFIEWLVSETSGNRETIKIFVESYIESPKQFLKTLTKKSDKIKEYGVYLKILEKSGYKWGYFFLDQMEESISGISKKAIGDFSIGFRRLIEEGANFASLICTLHYSSIRALMDSPTAEVNIKGFAPFDKNHFIGIYPEQLIKRDKFIQFITTYITEFRKDQNKEEVDIFPFESQVIDYIAFLTTGNLRDTLRIAHETLKKASSLNIDKINMDFVIANHPDTIGREFSEQDYNSFKSKKYQSFNTE